MQTVDSRNTFCLLQPSDTLNMFFRNSHLQFIFRIDIVITSLFGHGFDSFVRVGDLKAILSSLLPYSVYCKGGSSKQIKKLEVM